MSGAGRAKTGCSPSSAVGTLPHDQVVVSEHSPLYGSVNSTLFPFSKGRAIEKSMKVNPSLNWAWQIQDPHCGVSPGPFFSTAASSGFANSTMTASSAAVHQPHFLNTTIPPHHFSPSIKGTNLSHYCCRS
ncbi:unnamed protein product [Ilex paraguariensis]|uniref:Uncharacterized protein n=1 Tax=Ilex paraguariensis TaxID=185542 RepID=A0ABC8QSK6_9AQUA